MFIMKIGSRGVKPAEQQQSYQGALVSIDGLLQLRPAHLEAASWQSPSAVRLLWALDLICLTNSIVVNVGVPFALGASVTWLQLLQFVVFGSLAVLQLGVLLLQHEQYQRHRFKVTMFNRSLRLATVALAAATWTRADMLRFIATIDNTHSSSSSSSSGSVHLLLPAAPMLPAAPARSLWVYFIRSLLAVPLFFLNHANYVLPFAHVLPAQLWSLGSNLPLMRLTTCLIVERPGCLGLSQQLCQGVKLAMHYLALLGQSPTEAAQSAAEECQGVGGLLLLVLYTNVLVLVLVPCLAVYFVELDLELGFIKQRGLVLQHAYPCQESKAAKCLVVYGAVVGSWLACEVVVWLLGPMHCSSAGVLVSG